jgi:hypothetical protein
MASGHVNRTNRPNTWLHRPSLRRDDSPCQPGAAMSALAPLMGVDRTSIRRAEIDVNEP